MLPLISPEYAAMNRRLHEQNVLYGASGRMKKEGVLPIIQLCRQYGAKTVLDFGSGKGVRAIALRQAAPDLTIYEFDPAIPGRDTLPDQADAILAMDVMEHIEPDYLDAVLMAMRDLKPRVVYAMVCLVPAAKTLPDGRNAHLLVHNAVWWKAHFNAHFRVMECAETRNHCGILAVPG